MAQNLANLYEQAIEAPFLDSLTGFYNHGFFHGYLSQEISRCERYGHRCSLALIGIDWFSNFNRQKGHIEGDKTLKKLSEIIKHNTRESDLPARYSGDIIAILMIDCPLQEAESPLQRIRSEFEQSTEGELTVSIGVSSYSEFAPNKNVLIEKAEMALLEAKSSGKNRIVTFEKTIDRCEEGVPTVLIVDDEPKNVKLLKAILHNEDYHLIETLKGEDVFPLVSKHNIDLILLDVMMPGISGYDVCSQLKSREGTRLIPVVLVTALDDSESRIKGIEAGADDFISKPPNRSELIARVKSLIRMKSLNSKLTSIENVLFSFARVVEAKDTYTQGHIERVADLSIAIAQKMGLSGKQIQAIRIGGILHDIGKISVPNAILNKPDKLDDDEWRIMKKHPDVGYKIAFPLKNNLQSALKVIRHHHEKLDGSGYPDSLRGEEISVEARIMAVVDIYDALITDRPYRKAMGKEKAFEILRSEAEAGKLDRDIVNLLFDHIMK